MTQKKARRQARKQARSRQAQHRRRRAPISNADELRVLQRWLLPNNGIFASLRFHGNTGWLPSSLVWLALCWSWSESKNVTDAFTQAAEWCGLMDGNAALTTYQGFMGAVVQWTDKFLSVLWPLIHQRMRDVAGNLYMVHGWVPIAFDGSRSTAPRTESNEEAFCAPNYGNGTTAKYRKKKSKGMRRTKNEKSKAQPLRRQLFLPFSDN